MTSHDNSGLVQKAMVLKTFPSSDSKFFGGLAEGNAMNVGAIYCTDWQRHICLYLEGSDASATSNLVPILTRFIVCSL